MSSRIYKTMTNSEKRDKLSMKKFKDAAGLLVYSEAGINNDGTIFMVWIYIFQPYLNG